MLYFSTRFLTCRVYGVPKASAPGRDVCLPIPHVEQLSLPESVIIHLLPERFPCTFATLSSSLEHLSCYDEFLQM